MSLSPCISSTPATKATWFLSPLNNDSGGWGKRLSGIHTTGHPIHLITKHSAEAPFGERSHGTQMSLWLFCYFFLPTKRGLCMYLFPTFSCSQFSNHVPSKFLTIQSHHWLQPIHGYESIHLEFLLLSKVHNHMHCLEFC